MIGASGGGGRRGCGAISFVALDVGGKGRGDALQMCMALYDKLIIVIMRFKWRRSGGGFGTTTV